MIHSKRELDQIREYVESMKLGFVQNPDIPQIKKRAVEHWGDEITGCCANGFAVLGLGRDKLPRNPADWGVYFKFKAFWDLSDLEVNVWEVHRLVGGKPTDDDFSAVVETTTAWLNDRLEMSVTEIIAFWENYLKAVTSEDWSNE